MATRGSRDVILNTSFATAGFFLFRALRSAWDAATQKSSRMSASRQREAAAMLDPATVLLFAGALAIAAGSPGPSIAALVARVLSRGPRSVMPFLAAMWIGEAVWLSCAVLGLIALAQSFQLAFAVVKWAGLAYLLWLAWKMWTAPVTEAGGMPEAGGGWRLFGAGLAVTLGNPKIMVFYLALLPALVDLSAVGVIGWAELVAVMLAVLVAVDLAWVLAASQARRLFRSPSGRRTANRVSAGMMATAAGAIAVR
jgi:threonine/homoserine/homoserine lactone efflux protein